MSAPEKIYIIEWPNSEMNQIWQDNHPSVSKRESAHEYIREDLHAAVVAERDELRREVERLLATHQSQIREIAAADETIAQRNEAIEQLSARLGASCEWVPVAEADLQDGEKCSVFLPYGEDVIHDAAYDLDTETFSIDEGCEINIQEVSHILRIKPPAAKAES